MHQREPEKFEWYCLQKQEEAEQEEVEQEEVEQEEAEQEVDDIELDPTSEEDLDESMQSGTSNELVAHWEESEEWSEEWGGSTLSTLCHVLPLLCLKMP